MIVRRIDAPPIPEAMGVAIESFEAFDLRGDPLTEPLHAIAGRENIAGPDGKPDWRWHLSLSAEHDVPRWADLVAAAHRLRPGVVFVVGVPPRSWWLNLHPNVLHLWELKDEELTAQWRAESRGDTPT